MQYTSNAAVSELLSSRSTPPPPPANVAVQASVASAVDYLRTHGRRKGVSSQELARSLKLALIDEDVAAALERHRKVTKDDFGHWLYKSDIPHVTDQVGRNYLSLSLPHLQHSAPSYLDHGLAALLAGFLTSSLCFPTDSRILFCR